MDIYPTVVELAGLSLPGDTFFDGHSLVETIIDGHETDRYTK
jgi:arylsulfatase A-like enzyme